MGRHQIQTKYTSRLQWKVDTMDYKKFKQMGGVYKYGYGDSGWSKAKEELEQKKRVVLYQKIGIGFAILSFIATMVLIVTR